MIKDILLVMTRGDGDVNALENAVRLANLENAHLAVMIAVEYPTLIASELGGNPYPLYLGIYEESLRAANLLADLTRTKLSKEQIAFDVRVVNSPLINAAQAAAMHARHADLSLIAGNNSGERKAAVEMIFTDLLKDSGRPVLFVPATCKAPFPTRRILIAWQANREATRALHDAMDFLYRSESIDIIMIDPEVSEIAHGEQPGADIAAHLARHGLNVRVVLQPKMGRQNGQAILEYAIQTDAQLIVAGGYSHSRLREQIMGGVTKTLLQNKNFPVLFSH